MKMIKYITKQQYMTERDLDKKEFEDGILFNVACGNRGLPSVINFKVSRFGKNRRFPNLGPKEDKLGVKKLIEKYRNNLLGRIRNGEDIGCKLNLTAKIIISTWSKRLKDGNTVPITYDDLSNWRKMGIPHTEAGINTYLYPDGDAEYLSGYIPDFDKKYTRNAKGTIEGFDQTEEEVHVSYIRKCEFKEKNGLSESKFAKAVKNGLPVKKDYFKTPYDKRHGDGYPEHLSDEEVRSYLKNKTPCENTPSYLKQKHRMTPYDFDKSCKNGAFEIDGNKSGKNKKYILIDENKIYRVLDNLILKSPDIDPDSEIDRKIAELKETREIAELEEKLYKMKHGR
jgi:hypothetical protein